MTRRLSSFEDAAALLRAGALLVFPTETLVGLGCDARHERALARLAQIKGRRPDHPFPLLLPDDLPLAEVAVVPDIARRLAQRFWPGALTLVLPARAETPPAWRGPGETVGLRRSAHPVTRALVNALGGPLVATSANLSGRPPALSLDALSAELCAGVDAVLEGGPAPTGDGSTVVRVGGDGAWRVLREGALTAVAIAEALA